MKKLWKNIKDLVEQIMFDIEEIADYIENALNIDLNLPSAEEIAKNMGIPYGDVDLIRYK